MTRRLLFALPFVPRLLAAAAAEQAFDLFTGLASRLADDNAEGFMADIDTSLPGYADLRANVTALVAQASVQSSVVLLSNEGTDTVRTVELDWYLQLAGRAGTQAITRRREIVKCRVEKTGKKWKVFTLTPLGLFAPPTA
jgi:hypothetical protein